MKVILTLSIVLLLICGVFGDEVKMSVMEGHSVTLHTDLTDMRGVIKIIWRVGEDDAKSFLVEIDENKTINVVDSDVRFRDRLQVNHQTGDLTIKNMKIKHTGLYEAEINNNGGTTNKNFRVTVSDSPRFIDARTGDVKSVSVSEGESVTLQNDLNDIQNDTLILWRFGDEGLLIAKVDKEDNKSSIYYDEGFRGRLKLDDQTGSLTISDVRSSDSGLYKLKINNINQTLYKTFSVYVMGTQFSEPALVAYCLLLFLFLLVLMAICVYQCRHNISGLRLIIASCKSAGDKRGIYVVVFHCVVRVLLLVLLFVVGTYFYIMTLDLTEMEEMSSTSLAVLLGVLLMLPFLAVMKVFQRISQQKQRGICLSFLGLLLLLLLLLIVVIYTVCFMDLKQMEGHLANIYITLLVLMLLAVVHHFSKSSYGKLKVQKMLMFKGESVFLPTGVTELQSDDVIQLNFRDEMIAEFNNHNMLSSDERFRERLQVDVQTGSLIIRNMRKEDAGLYKVMMSSNSRLKSFFQFIIAGGPSYSQFSVIFYDSAGIRENETLMVVKSLLNEAEDV